MRWRMFVLTTLVIVLSALSARCSAADVPAYCWTQAAQQYGVSAQLLYAVASAESGLNPRAINSSHKARTGTVDIGLMQINSGHLGRLAAVGISEASLYEPCTNIKVGAWLLADAFARHGVSWNAVGSYNAACTRLKGDECTAARSKYAWRVYRRLPGNASTASRPVREVASDVAPQPAPLILSARVSR